MVRKSLFGTLPDGRAVTMYTLENAKGEYVEILDFGASMHSIFVRDREGKLGDVLLGVTDATELANRSFEGTMIGRVGNRIAEGRCVLDGRQVQLEVNHGGHFLHGASGNYAFRMFQAEVSDQSVTLYTKDTGEGGWNDCVDVWMTYSFDDDSNLKLQYHLVPEGTTALSPTNHAYFNLGDYGDAMEHVLRLYCANVAKKGDNGVPAGGLQSVAGTPLDFRMPRRIGEAMSSDRSFFKGPRIVFDDFYVRDQTGWGLAADLYAPSTGRRMQVWTDMQSVIFFTPDNCPARRGKRGITYPFYAGVCLETQFVPNAVNLPEFQSPVFHKGEALNTTTIYAFSAGE